MGNLIIKMQMDLEKLGYTNVNIFKQEYEQKHARENLTTMGGDRQAAGFNPYQENEGTVCAVAGKDFVVCCTDTRISSGYSILKRDHKKTTKLTATCMITSGGMVADIDALHKNLLTRIHLQNAKQERAFSRKHCQAPLQHPLRTSFYAFLRL